MSYTKGPLKISGPSQGGSPDDDGGDYAIIESGGMIIGEAFHRIGEDDYRDAEANARLWASAPDLLAERDALRNLLAALADAVDDYTIEVGKVERGECEYADQGNLYDLVEQARVALDAASSGERSENDDDT